MQYRREIDGLRAVAVIPVVFFHAGFEGFSGGFLGVDVFFVISGYLITSIILKDLAAGSFSLSHFYERRARRILPALFGVLAVCLPFAWYLLLPSDFERFGASLIAAATFSSNFLFWQESGYFDVSTELKPLLHTWSLAVEEQYYILFPVFMLLVWRLGRSAILVMLILIFIFSLGLAHTLSVYGKYETFFSASFYLLPTRGWEILLGVFVAFYLNKNGYLSSKAVNQGGSILGAGLVAFSMVLFTEDTPVPSLYTLLPTVGTCLVIICTVRNTWLYQLLSNSVLVGVGLISYSVYLWHQPLIAFAKYRYLSELQGVELFALCLVSFVLGYFSWAYIERPFRSKNKMPSRAIIGVSLAGISSFAFLGIAIQDVTNFRDRSTFYKAYEIGGYKIDDQALLDESWELLERKTGYEYFCLKNCPGEDQLWFSDKDSRTKVLVVGNSHSVDFYNVLNFSENAKQHLQLARYGASVRSLGEETSGFFKSANYQNAEVIVIASLNIEEDLDHFEKVVSRITSDGKRLIILRSIFTWMERESFTVLDKLVFKSQDEGASLQTITNLVNDTYTQDFKDGRFVSWKRKNNSGRERFILGELQKQYTFVVLDRMEYVCGQGICKMVSDNLDKYFYDMGHHTLLGARYFGKQLDNSRWIEKYFLNEPELRVAES